MTAWKCKCGYYTVGKAAIARHKRNCKKEDQMSKGITLISTSIGEVCFLIGKVKYTYKIDPMFVEKIKYMNHYSVGKALVYTKKNAISFEKEEYINVK